MSLTIIFSVIIIHYFADFVMQTDEMAINKSKSNKHLLEHVYTYSLIWFIFGAIYTISQGNNYVEWTVSKFVGITFICHFITDYFTSRLSSYLYQKEQRHNFFLVVGADQVLHYIQLFLTFKLLTQI